MAANSEMQTLEQQLQEYRAKLAAYKTDVQSTGGSASVSGGNAGGGNASVSGVTVNTVNIPPLPDKKPGPPASKGGSRSQLSRQSSASSRSSALSSQSYQDSPTPRQRKSILPPDQPTAPSSDVSPSIDSRGAETSQEDAGTMFNYDDDFENDGSIGEDSEEALTWRTDPEKSLSDWTINISNRSTRQTQSYHVHRNVLAVGPRRSEYFVRFFLSHDRLHKTGHSTDIWLEGVAADAMSLLLDFMYSPEGKLNIDTKSAIGLRHLAQFFGMRGLHKRVMAFIQKDLNMQNIKTYYQSAAAVDDNKVSELASECCARNILDISESHSLLPAVDPLFFRRIMLSPEINTKEKQLHTSQLLAAFCVLHKNLLDDQDFIRLTDEQCLPHVHYKAALTLMEMETDLVVLDHDTEEMTSLQERCLRDIATHWEELSKMKAHELTRICRKLPSPVVTEIMVRSLSQAKRSVDKEKLKNSSSYTSSGDSVGSGTSEQRMRRDYEKRMALLQRQHQETLDSIKAEFEANLVKMREAVVEKYVSAASRKWSLCCVVGSHASLLLFLAETSTSTSIGTNSNGSSVFRISLMGRWFKALLLLLSL